MWLSKAIHVDGTNQFDTNTCHNNKKLDQILNHLHLFWDFPKSPINEYSDLTFMRRILGKRKKMAPVGIMISAGLNSNNIMNSVSIYNDISLISSNSNENY